MQHPGSPTSSPQPTQIIQAVLDHRGLTTPQIHRLLFEPASLHFRTCERALRRLAENLFVERARLSSLGNTPFLYLPTQRGIEELAFELDVPTASLGWDPGHNAVKFIRQPHHWAINDMRIALTVSAKRAGFQIVLVRDEQTVKREHAAEKAGYAPDTFMTIARQENGELFHFLLEADRRTESLDRWQKKIRACERFYSSGLYEAMYGTRDMRVLTATTGPKRAANLKNATEAAGGRIRYYFATADDTMAAAFLEDPIWHVAGRKAPRSIL